MRWGLVLAVLLTAGCFKATFGDPTAVPGIEHDRWTDFYVFGLVGDEVIDVREFCPDGRASEVRTGGDVLSVVVTIVTIGIYAPRIVYVTCSAGTMQARARDDVRSRLSLAEQRR